MHRIQGHRRFVLGLGLGLALGGLAAGTAGCSSTGTTGSTSDATPAAAAIASTAANTSAASSSDPGCRKALSDVSHYGPSTVKLLADGRKSVAKAAVQLLVDGLDGAADAANSAEAKQAIQTLATAYEAYFDLTTDAVAIPLSTLLKDTVDFDAVCG